MGPRFTCTSFVFIIENLRKDKCDLLRQVKKVSTKQPKPKRSRIPALWQDNTPVDTVQYIPDDTG